MSICWRCKCRPAALSTLTGFDDECTACDASVHVTTEFMRECRRLRRPQVPMHPICDNKDVCECGWLAIRNRAPPREGPDKLPQHMIVTIPITAKMHIIVCLICNTVFKHHSNAVKHFRQQHIPYHAHRVGGVASGQ